MTAGNVARAPHQAAAVVGAALASTSNAALARCSRARSESSVCTGLAAGACDRPVQCFSSRAATAVPSSQHRRVDSPIYYYPPSQPSVRGLVRLSAARRRRRRSPPLPVHCFYRSRRRCRSLARRSSRLGVLQAGSRRRRASSVWSWRTRRHIQTNSLESRIFTQVA